MNILIKSNSIHLFFIIIITFIVCVSSVYRRNGTYIKVSGMVGVLSILIEITIIDIFSDSDSITSGLTKDTKTNKKTWPKVLSFTLQYRHIATPSSSPSHCAIPIVFTKFYLMNLLLLKWLFDDERSFWLSFIVNHPSSVPESILNSSLFLSKL